ncbi:MULTISPECIES: hypothetical protein [unclassified Streptomyces]|uniref:hypothetical protein n=1 Tax=unclassified Streptomyces TaxID=2593676 RepID=UPI003806B3D3
MTGDRGPLGSETRSLSTDDLSGARDATAEAPPAAFPGKAAPAGRPPEAVDEAEPAPVPGAGAGPAADEAADEPLLGSEQDEFRSRWQRIQGDFVDDPREAVGAADTLVAEVMQALARTFSDHKQALEGQWQRGEEVATEDLRVALQRYRSFFNRLLKT